MKQQEQQFKTLDEVSADERRGFFFNTLYTLNVNDKVEKKNGLTFLTWSYAWPAFKKIYPSATYKVIKNPENNMPYFVDPQMGIMVYTEVTADGLTHEMWLPVLDNTFHPMKLEPYTYQVYDSYKKQYIEKTVQAVSMFDINKTIMRCLVKNLAMFGLGLYIYVGEDLPLEESITPKQTPTDRFEAIRSALNKASNTNELLALYQQLTIEIQSNPEILGMFTRRKQELLKAA